MTVGNKIADRQLGIRNYFRIVVKNEQLGYIDERQLIIIIYYNSVFFLLYIINEGQSLGIKNEACGKIPKF